MHTPQQRGKLHPFGHGQRGIHSQLSTFGTSVGRWAVSVRPSQQCVRARVPQGPGCTVRRPASRTDNRLA
eukprot:4661110-Alexandrium_andersonii.AAC.1